MTLYTRDKKFYSRKVLCYTNPESTPWKFSKITEKYR